MEEDKDWTKADLKEYYVYRKGIWVLKEEVQQIKQMLKDAQRRLDRELQIESRQMTWWEYIWYYIGIS
jgi:hypothetical protein